MKLSAPIFISWLVGAVVASPVLAESGMMMVPVKKTPTAAWTNYPTRTLTALPDAVAQRADSGLDQYGGLAGPKQPSTGFFYAKQVAGRWWLVDPAGGLFIHKAVVAVSPVGGPGARAAFKDKFGGNETWADRTEQLLLTNGFNGLGAWSATGELRAAPHPMAYTLIWDFMSSYGKQRGGTYQQSGHIGYPKDCIFVFDPDFEKFCDGYAKQLAKYKDDPWLLGHFSDNEMPYKRDAILNYLELPAKDPGHQAALAWLQKRHGVAATAKDVTEQDRRDFLALVTERYHQIVSRAIKKYDPHHLFLGSRFNAAELNYPEVFKAAGPYLDVVSVNYYRMWTPSQSQMAMWSRESGKPILITEWYVKGEDSGLPNHSGAGWIVKSQEDRGRFYQNFTLGLLQSKVCVGWHWFKYADNDPTEPGTEPSNRDANKGIVTARYQPYPALLKAMREINERTYSLVDYFDKSTQSPGQSARNDSADLKTGFYAN